MSSTPKQQKGVKKMLDTTLLLLLVTLIVQGLKQIGFDIKDNGAKVIALFVAALFLFANGLIDLFVPAAYRPLLQQIVDIIKAFLTLFAPAGVYSFAKLFAK